MYSIALISIQRRKRLDKVKFRKTIGKNTSRLSQISVRIRKYSQTQNKVEKNCLKANIAIPVYTLTAIKAA
jgi:hypothetical protein